MPGAAWVSVGLRPAAGEWAGPSHREAAVHTERPSCGVRGGFLGVTEGDDWYVSGSTLRMWAFPIGCGDHGGSE